MGSWMDDRGAQEAGRGSMEPDAPMPAAAWSTPPEGASARSQVLLAHALECEIIPRLMKSHEQSPGAPGHARARAIVTDDDIHDFARCILDQELSFARARLEAFETQGLALEHLYLDLLGPVAQLMGQWWVEDALSFTEVTVGLGRLQQLLREISARNESERPVAGRRILLLATPGEQHTFGLAMVAELFAHAGWDVCGDPVDGGGDAVRRVREEWFDVVGFTMGTVEQAGALRDLVERIRLHSLNPRVGIMLGGSAVMRVPQCAAQIRVDGVAVDGREAVALAAQLVKVAAQGQAA